MFNHKSRSSFSRKGSWTPSKCRPRNSRNCRKSISLCMRSSNWCPTELRHATQVTLTNRRCFTGSCSLTALKNNSDSLCVYRGAEEASEDFRWETRGGWWSGELFVVSNRWQQTRQSTRHRRNKEDIGGNRSKQFSWPSLLKVTSWTMWCCTQFQGQSTDEWTTNIQHYRFRTEICH